MRYWIFTYPKLKANAMALFPIILLRNQAQKNNLVLINHEKIHLKQQLELLILPFYLLYALHYLIQLIRFKNHYQAYYHIVFEQEAYLHENDLSYLAHRKTFAWSRYLKTRSNP